MKYKKIITISVLILLMISINIIAANKKFIKDVVILNEGAKNAKLVITLNEPGNVFVYYDNQMPNAPNMLHTFWFYNKSTDVKLKHTIELQDLINNTDYYLKIQKRRPKRITSKLIKWKYYKNISKRSIYTK